LLLLLLSKIYYNMFSPFAPIVVVGCLVGDAVIYHHHLFVWLLGGSEAERWEFLRFSQCLRIFLRILWPAAKGPIERQKKKKSRLPFPEAAERRARCSEAESIRIMSYATFLVNPVVSVCCRIYVFECDYTYLRRLRKSNDRFER